MVSCRHGTDIARAVPRVAERLKVDTQRSDDRQYWRSLGWSSRYLPAHTVRPDRNFATSNVRSGFIEANFGKARRRGRHGETFAHQTIVGNPVSADIGRLGGALGS